MCCTKCESKNVVKGGFIKAVKRLCYQFVPTKHHGKSEQEKLTAVLLYISGLSLRTIAKLLKVSNEMYQY